jgi:hypothetical protein
MYNFFSFCRLVTHTKENFQLSFEMEAKIKEKNANFMLYFPISYVNAISTFSGLCSRFDGITLLTIFFVFHEFLVFAKYFIYWSLGRYISLNNLSRGAIVNLKKT